MQTTPRLGWTTIQEIFAGEWVELVDYKWNWQEGHPTSAKIRHHACSHAELMRMIDVSDPLDTSTILLISDTHPITYREVNAAVF